jgi:hypothetical protein
LGREDGGGAGVVWGWTVQWWPGWGVVSSSSRWRSVAATDTATLRQLCRSCRTCLVDDCYISSDSHAYCFYKTPFWACFRVILSSDLHNFHSIILCSDLTILSMFSRLRKKM